MKEEAAEESHQLATDDNSKVSRPPLYTQWNPDTGTNEVREFTPIQTEVRELTPIQTEVRELTPMRLKVRDMTPLYAGDTYGPRGDHRPQVLLILGTTQYDDDLSGKCSDVEGKFKGKFRSPNTDTVPITNSQTIDTALITTSHTIDTAYNTKIIQFTGSKSCYFTLSSTHQMSFSPLQLHIYPPLKFVSFMIC